MEFPQDFCQIAICGLESHFTFSTTSFNHLRLFNMSRWKGGLHSNSDLRDFILSLFFLVISFDTGLAVMISMP